MRDLGTLTRTNDLRGVIKPSLRIQLAWTAAFFAVVGIVAGSVHINNYDGRLALLEQEQTAWAR